MRSAGARSLQVCQFLDAVDAQSFRAQLLAERPRVHRFGVEEQPDNTDK